MTFANVGHQIEVGHFAFVELEVLVLEARIGVVEAEVQLMHKRALELRSFLPKYMQRAPVHIPPVIVDMTPRDPAQREGSTVDDRLLLDLTKHRYRDPSGPKRQHPDRDTRRPDMGVEAGEL